MFHFFTKKMYTKQTLLQVLTLRLTQPQVSQSLPYFIKLGDIVLWRLYWFSC